MSEVRQETLGTNRTSDDQVKQERPERGPSRRPIEDVQGERKPRPSSKLFNHSMAGSRSTADLEEIVKTFEAICKQYAEVENIVIEVKPISHNLAIPAILLIYREGSNKVRYTALLPSGMLQGTIADKEENERGQKYYTPRFAADLWPGLMEDTAEDLINRTYFNGNAQKGWIRLCSVIVLPEHSDYRQLNTAIVAFDHGVTALLAISRLEKGESTASYSYQDFEDRGMKLSGIAEVNPTGTILSTLGEPLAVDFKLSVLAKTVNNGSENLHDTGTSIAITTVYGAIDFQLLPEEEEVKTINRDKFYPVVIPKLIIKQSSSVNPNNPENTDCLMSQILGLLMVRLYSEKPERWGQMFEPDNASQNNNIGALGLVGNPYADTTLELGVHNVVSKVTHGRNAGGKLVADLLNEYCSVAPMIILEIPEGGPLEALQNYLVEETGANYSIIANELSSFVGDPGSFADSWESEGGPARIPILELESPLNLPLIRYTGHAEAGGILHDPNEIDLLHLLNVGVSMDVIQDYDQLHSPGANHPAELNQRYSNIKRVLDNAKITGTSVQYCINMDWLNLVDDFLGSYGITIDLDEGLTFGNNAFGLSRGGSSKHAEGSAMFRRSGLSRTRTSRPTGGLNSSRRSS